MVVIEENVEFKTDFDKAKIAEDVVGEILKKEGCPFECEVDILITDSEEVKEYNREYRDIDKTTDVLSFPNLEWEAPSDFENLNVEDLEMSVNPETELTILGEICLNKDRIVFAGDSAGGHIAAALIVMLKDRNQPIPRGAMLIYPALDKRMITESMKYTDTPIFDSKCYKLFWSMYLKDQNADEAKYASVAELDHLEFFPDTYVEVAEFDCLHDEGIAFAEKLISSGVSAEYHSVDGTFHGFEAASKSSILDRCIKRRIRVHIRNWETSI